jgi:hypothetical protein
MAHDAVSSEYSPAFAIVFAKCIAGKKKITSKK